MKFIPYAPILSLALCSALFLTVMPLAPAADEVNGIAATVNGEVVTRAEVAGAVMTQTQLWLFQNQMATPAQREAEIAKIKAAALKDLIDRKLILAEFKKKGGVIKRQYVDQAVDKIILERFKGDRSKFNEELQKSGLTFPDFRRIQAEQITVGAMRSQNSGGRIMVNTPKEREETYLKHRDQFATDSFVKLRMISIPKQTVEGEKSAASQRALIDEIQKKLAGGADFATMAKTYSQDSFAADGGSAGTIGKDVLNEKLTEIAFSLEPRKVSQVIDDGADWRLLYVDAKQEGKTPPLSEVMEQVDKMVTQEKRQAIVENWLKRLHKDADVRIFSN
jgi:parvulin-like peptidyl-prolyl isomerase